MQNNIILSFVISLRLSFIISTSISDFIPYPSSLSTILFYFLLIRLLLSTQTASSHHHHVCERRAAHSSSPSLCRSMTPLPLSVCLHSLPLMSVQVHELPDLLLSAWLKRGQRLAFPHTRERKRDKATAGNTNT